MYGWRARIGLLIANSNTTMEPEFYKLAPEGVSVHTQRVQVGGITKESVSGTASDVERAAHMLRPINAKAFGYACTVANLAEGTESDTTQAKIITDITGRPAVTATAAIYEAFAALGAKRIAIATPYPKELNDASRLYWETAGFEVVNIDGVNLGGDRSVNEPFSSIPVSLVGLQHPATAFNLARKAFVESADALLISGANLRSIEIIQAAEDDFGIPVISSSTAVIWATLQAAGVKTPITGYGRLLAQQPTLGWKRVPRV